VPPRAPRHPATTLALVVAVSAVSSSAPLIAFAAAPALAIAFWRNALAVGVIGPVALVRPRRRAELAALARGPGRRAGLSSLLAGVALAVHFGTWVPSAKLTSAATATALVATQPVWQGLIARAQGRRLRPAAWAGIGVAVAGGAIATGADVGISSRAVVGDLLAAAGGVAGAVYIALGERARATTSTTAYTAVCYTVCTVLLGAVCAWWGVPLAGFDARTWLAIAALAAGAQLLGHSLFNYALHRTPATTISVVALLEVPGAAFIAWAWLGQLPRPAALPGLALVVLGVLVVVLDGARHGRATTVPAGAAPATPGVVPGRDG
jgi:drug/metabolite transporter (DMT)-like permease